jgi:hypothetical protein
MLARPCGKGPADDASPFRFPESAGQLDPADARGEAAIHRFADIERLRNHARPGAGATAHEKAQRRNNQCR